MPGWLHPASRGKLIFPPAATCALPTLRGGGPGPGLPGLRSSKQGRNANRWKKVKNPPKTEAMEELTRCPARGPSSPIYGRWRRPGGCSSPPSTAAEREAMAGRGCHPPSLPALRLLSPDLLALPRREGGRASGAPRANAGARSHARERVPPPRIGDHGLPQRGWGNPDPPLPASRSGGFGTGRWRKERRALPGECLLLGAAERSARIRG